MRYIEDFKEGETIVGHYLCKSKETLKSKAGKSYMSLKLMDKTGMIDSKVWELSNSIGSFEVGDFIKVEGTVTLYQNEFQFRITKLRKSAEGEYAKEDYIPSTDKDIDSMYGLLVGYIKSIDNSYIRTLTENIMLKNPQIQAKLKQHSAAKNMHHAYMGGLVEHILSVVQICDFMSTRYKFVNRDILISCAMLHDIGKIFELSDFPENDYTDDGELLGHIIIGSELISEEADKIPNFPPKLKSLMKHCILAHHGEYEYGSPKLPKTIEAFILHCCDNMDAKVKMFEEFLEKDKTPGDWVGYNRILERNIRKSDYV